MINKRPALPSTTTSTSLPPSVGIYVTYQRKEDAVRCIQAVDGTTVGGRILRFAYIQRWIFLSALTILLRKLYLDRASLGTTKYCTYYLRNVTCPNPACMYLHEPGDDADSISKEELASGYVVFTSSRLIHLSSQYSSCRVVFHSENTKCGIQCLQNLVHDLMHLTTAHSHPLIIPPYHRLQFIITTEY